MLNLLEELIPWDAPWAFGVNRFQVEKGGRFHLQWKLVEEQDNQIVKHWDWLQVDEEDGIELVSFLVVSADSLEHDWLAHAGSLVDLDDLVLGVVDFADDVEEDFVALEEANGNLEGHFDERAAALQGSKLQLVGLQVRFEALVFRMRELECELGRLNAA